MINTVFSDDVSICTKDIFSMAYRQIKGADSIENDIWFDLLLFPEY